MVFILADARAATAIARAELEEETGLPDVSILIVASSAAQRHQACQTYIYHPSGDVARCALDPTQIGIEEIMKKERCKCRHQIANCGRRAVS